MQDNPYLRMIRLMREQGAKYNQTPYVIGSVINVVPDILIQVKEMQVDKSDLLLNESLILDYFSIGDKVLLIPPTDEYEKYIIVCKLTGIL